ncbi:MAG: aldehyde dehydrogenase family protein, partial [Gemmatimonadales bacterium]
VEASIRFIQYMAGWATKITGQTLDLGTESPTSGAFAYTRREPVGVVAGIVPWNMPLSMAVWKAIPALACGCTVVIKPAPESPLASLRLAELAAAVGLPPGVLSVVTGGDRAGAALVAHPLVAKVAFTGSTEVGKLVGVAAMSRLARVTLELGGKSPAIVLADADLEVAAQQVARGIFYNQGQICAAGSRLLVERGIFDEVVSGVARLAASMRLGSGFDPASEIGPLVSSRQRDRVNDYIRSGTADGARVVAGGPPPPGAGYFVRPTVFAGGSPSMRVVREEVFGPVLVALPFDDMDDLVAQVNGSRYGLAASIYSNNLSAVRRLIPRLQVGGIFVNSPARTDPNLPMGGVKESG